MYDGDLSTPGLPRDRRSLSLASGRDGGLPDPLGGVFASPSLNSDMIYPWPSRWSSRWQSLSPSQHHGVQPPSPFFRRQPQGLSGMPEGVRSATARSAIDLQPEPA